MKVSDYIIDFLAKKGIKHAFVVSGGAAVHLIDSISKHPDMDYICAQHEQNGAAGADMYSRVSRNLGLTVTTSGPGATNILTSVCSAYFDSIPLICLAGQVARFRIKEKKELRQKGFQETDVVSIFSPVTKYAKQILDPFYIRYELEKAVYLATNGRCGPVLLDIPDDLQREEIEPEQLIGFIPESKSFFPLKNQLETLQKWISQSKRPIIIAGAGIHISKSENQAIQLFEQLNIPVCLTWGGKDLLPSDHPLNIGCIGVCGPRHGNFAVQNADLIIALGTRLSQMITGGKQDLFAPQAKKVMIDIDLEELNKFKSNTICLDLGIHSHLNSFFSSFLLIASKENRSFHAWRRQIKIWEKKYPLVISKTLNENDRVDPYFFIQSLSSFCEEEELIIADTGATICSFMQAFKTKKNQRIFSAWNNTPMGFSLPASIGAALASEQRVVCIIGDGGLMMCLEEIATITRHQLPVLIFLFNNRGHAIQKQTMDIWLASHYSAVHEESGLYFPNYEKIAEAFNIPYFTIKNNCEIASLLEKISECKGPIFCNVEIIENHKIIPMLKFGSGIEDLDPKLPLKEIQKVLNSKSKKNSRSINHGK